MGIFYILRYSTQAYEIKLERETDCEEVILCSIVTGNSTLTDRLVYRNPKISQGSEQSGLYYYWGFNHEILQWKFLQSTRSEDQHCSGLVQDSFLI